MLVKSHCLDYSEDFGLLSQDKQLIHFYEAGTKKNSKKLQLSPVIRANVLWVEKLLKVKCEVADTLEKKKQGLQDKEKLNENGGLYFPYEPFTQVSFHQGSVKYPLDLLFICEDKIIQTKENTRVGGKDRWACEECDGVVEVLGGWCERNEVEVGDRIFISAVSKQDLYELEREKASDLLMALAESIE